jgi:endonuclease/exonuclease/phosphatase family metal-dependent hydrolase
MGTCYILIKNIIRMNYHIVSFLNMKVKKAKTVSRIWLWCVFIIGILVDANAQEAVHQVALTDPAVMEASTPAPLFRDPVYDGAADPVLVWNPSKQVWWMFYTQRRAKIDVPGVEWCHGTEIGVAESRDSGFSWTYIGTLPLSHPDNEYSFWAPDVILDDKGVFHLFPSYVPGAAETHRNWGGERHIFHYTSKDLWNWKFQERVPLSSDYCIDATLFRKPDRMWRMWYKDEGHGSKTLAVESSDLMTWSSVEDPGVSKLYGEGPKTFWFKGHYWLIKDPNSGLDVYQSSDLEHWIYQGKILDQAGTRNSDGTIGKHADVVVSGDRAYIIYFTHPYSENAPERNGVLPLSNRHTALQAAEIEVIDGRLVCDRDKPFHILLQPPQEKPVQLKVLSYNIHYGVGMDSKKDLKRIADVINRINPDIVGLQEVADSAMTEMLSQMTNMVGVFGASTEIETPNLYGLLDIPVPTSQLFYGDAILSKYPFQYLGNHSIPSASSSRYEAMCVDVNFYKKYGEERIVRFITTHFDYLKTIGSEVARKAAVEVIEKAFIKDDEGIPYVMTGDLNATPQSAVLKLLEQKGWITGVSGREFPTVPSISPNKQIDYVLVRPEKRWRIIDVTVIEEGLASDHRPILMTLELVIEK